MTHELSLDDDMLNKCVQCGLCLPHCPTWRVTGEEARSPRGRIDIMRNVQWNGAPLDAGAFEAIDSCVGCRSCETACPSGVQYGEMLHAITNAMAAGGGPGHVPRWQRFAISLLARPRLVRSGALMVAVAQRCGLAGVGALSNLPLLPLRRPRLDSTGDDVVLLTGCVMDATQRQVHAAAVSALGAAGFGVRLQPDPGCCGALASHRGLPDLAERQLYDLARSIPRGVPVLSDAAGCAAAISEAGRAAASPGVVSDMAERTVDISAFLLEHADRLPEPTHDTGRPAVVVAQPCHQRNVIGPAAAQAVTDLLGRYVEVHATDDDDLCCGAGGSHSVLRPQEAAAIRDRKVSALRRTGVELVVSANPGCAMHLQAAGMLVEHPVEVLARVLRQQRPGLRQDDETVRRVGNAR